MSRCQCIVERRHKVSSTSGILHSLGTTRKVWTLCSHTAVAFFRVQYNVEKMGTHHGRLRQSQGVFGFCAVHQNRFRDPSEYDKPGALGSGCYRPSVDGLLAPVLSLEEVSGEEALLADKHVKKIASVRAQIFRLMSQKNNEKFTTDDWRAVLDGLPEELVVRKVLEG